MTTTLPASHAQSGRAIHAFGRSQGMQDLKAIVASRVKAIRKRPMLQRDFDLIREGLALAKEMEPCTILRECNSEGSTQRDMVLRLKEVTPYNTAGELNLRTFLGNSFQISRDAYDAATALFPLIVDAAKLGLTQMQQDVTIFRYDETFLDVLGIAILYSEAAEQLPHPIVRAPALFPIRNGLAYKGYLSPNDLRPADFANISRRHSFNRVSASNKEKFVAFSAGDGYQDFFTTLERAVVVDSMQGRESDTYHALFGLLGRPKEDGFLHRLCAAYVDDRHYPLSPNDQKRKDNIINGLVDMMQDRSFVLTPRYSTEEVSPPRAAISH